MNVAAVRDFLVRFAPPRLAEGWDNVGLLVGDPLAPVRRILTCLTITPPVVEEAIAGGAELIVAHHPLPFHAVKRITTETVAGRTLLRLIAAGVAIYSPHTAFDSAAEGINQRLADGLGLCDIAPLVPHPEGQGTGRRGRFDKPIALGELAYRLMTFLNVAQLQMVGETTKTVSRVAVGCGAAGELLEAALTAGCEAMVLGEARFHTCLEAEAQGVGLLLPGHYASERFAVEALAGLLGRQFPEATAWPSRAERDPLRWVSAAGAVS